MRKNHLIILLVLFISIGASSCSKTYNCVCSVRGSVSTVTPIKSLGKYGAKNVCDSYQEENNRVYHDNMACVIK